MLYLEGRQYRPPVQKESRGTLLGVIAVCILIATAGVITTWEVWRPSIVAERAAAEQDRLRAELQESQRRVADYKRLVENYRAQIKALTKSVEDEAVLLEALRQPKEGSWSVRQ